MSRVRVVIPTYNRRHLVLDAVQSALDQTLGDVEVVVVDDGSTDDTAGLFQGFPDPRVRYVAQKNQGVSSARNLGISQPDCPPYLAFLDSDDVWVPTHLADSISAMEQHGVSAACGRKRVVDYVGLHTAEGALHENDVQMEALVPIARFTGGFIADVREATYLGKYAPVTSTVVVRSNAAERWFDPTFRVLEDLELFARLPQPFAVLSSVQVTYRQVGNNLTGERRLESDEMLQNQLSVFRFYELGMRHFPGQRARVRLGNQAYFVGQCYQARGEFARARAYYRTAVRVGCPWPAVKSYAACWSLVERMRGRSG